MIYTRPDYYDDFQCIASQCRHSCCVGWEIDIDEDTADYYACIPGEIGETIRNNISPGDDPHFLLTEGEERCPFLRRDGLCRLIIELGEESLCDICREHPRFYNELSDRTEMGIGMCCEEAARLLCEGTKGTELLFDSDEEEGEYNEEEQKALALRDELFTILKGDKPLYEHLVELCEKCGTDMPGTDIVRWAEFYLTLERLDESWTEALDTVRRYGADVDLETEVNRVKYRRITEYILYRHFIAAARPELAVQHAVVAALMICCMDVLCGDDSEHLRMYSAEIEYSDENLELIYDRLSELESSNTADIT